MILDNNGNDSIISSNSIIGSQTSLTDTTTTEASSVLKKLNTLDTSLSYSLDSRLSLKEDSIKTAYSVANDGVAFSQYTSVALTQQYNILTEVKNKLTHITTNETTSSEKETLRQNIVESLTKFDTIAQDSNYNKLYYLQKSNTSTDASEIYNFQVSEFPEIAVSTKSIQSNTKGLGLDTLKNLQEGELTNTASVTGLNVSKEALEAINNFQDIYNTLQKEFQSSIKELTNTYNNLNSLSNNLKNIDYAQESANFSKADIFKQHGSLVVAQANTTQKMVSSLLS